jgi:hypothetical protein
MPIRRESDRSLRYHFNPVGLDLKKNGGGWTDSELLTGKIINLSFLISRINYLQFAETSSFHSTASKYRQANTGIAIIEQLA